jgi:hypothetical protein
MKNVMPRIMSELQTIGTYATAVEAHVARLALEQVGIEVFIEDEYQPFGGGLAWPTDGVKLKVRVEDVERAVDVLKAGRA